MTFFEHPCSRALSRPLRQAQLCALAAVICSAVPLAHAQQPTRGAPAAAAGNQWALGVGVFNSQSAYKGMERQTRALPLIRFENEYVKAAGLGLEVKLPSLELGPSKRVKFGLVGRLDMAGYEASDSPVLAGMDKRRSGFWVGARAEWDNALAPISAEWTADASGHSKGQRLSLGIEKNFRLGRQVMVAPYLRANWLDAKYVGYYYGVRAAEVRAGRAAYAGQGGMNVDAGLRTLYLIDRHHSLLLDVAVTGLAKEIKASPLVDRSSTNRVLLGYSYSF